MDSERRTPSRFDRLSSSVDTRQTEQVPEGEPEAVNKAVEFLRPLLRDPDQAPQTAARVVAVTEMFSGPMPHPGHFKAYEEAVPGSGKDILSMAKKEQSHRHKTQSLEMLYPYFGLVFGFIAFAGCIGSAVFLALRGHDTVSALMLGVPTLGVIGWFINSRLEAAESSPQTVPQNLPSKPAKRRR